MPQNAMSALGMLAIAILILAAAYFVTRWLGTWQMRGPSGAFRPGGAGNVRVVSQTSLGRNERLVLVRVGRQCLLLGVTAEHVSVIREFTEAEAEELCSQPEAGQATGFADILKDSLRKRK